VPATHAVVPVPPLAAGKVPVTPVVKLANPLELTLFANCDKLNACVILCSYLS